MSNTIRRHALFEHVRSTWGVDTAETLMDLLPIDRDELATKADLQVGLAGLASELRAEMSQQTRLLMVSMLTIEITIVLAVLAAWVAR